MNLRRGLRRALAYLCLALAGPLTCAAQQAPTEQLRQRFMDAMAATRSGQPAAADDPALRGYVLYPYLQAARLQRQLQTATPAAPGTVDASLPVDAEIAAFLASQGRNPVARELRGAWLASLARRGSWPAFLAEFDPGRDTAATTLCQSFTARVVLGRTAGLVEDLSAAWLTPRNLPDACDGPLGWWKERGGPGTELIERRARLALQSGEAALARVLAGGLPASRSAPLLQWALLIEQPTREIPALIAEPERRVEPEALQDGWLRFARADAARAAATYPSLVASRRLDARNASPLALSVALALAWSRLPGALDFFALVHPDDFDERGHEWHARAALWAGNWQRVAGAIVAMPDALRTQPRWQYWAARAAERLGNFAAARAGYAAVIPTDNWYAALASARLDRKVTPNLQPLPLDDTNISALEAEPGFRRARELLYCRMADEASA
ncbi:MAG: hypothetical protein ACR2I8_08080, partial [Steroidobacteraceae bacterium]